MLFCGTEFGDTMDQTKTKIAPCFSLEAQEVRQKTELYTTHVYLSCVDGIDLTPVYPLWFRYTKTTSWDVKACL